MPLSSPSSPTRFVAAALARARCDGDAGFTVLEALVSFVLLAVVAGGATTAITKGISTSDTSSNRSTAANLAQQDLQSARSLRYPNYPAALSTTTTVAGTRYTVRRTVGHACPTQLDYDNHAYEIVTTTVSWPPATTADQVSMATELTC